LKPYRWIVLTPESVGSNPFANVAQTTDGATALSTKVSKGRKTAIGGGNHPLTPDGKVEYRAQLAFL
jgi:hypothetical protein